MPIGRGTRWTRPNGSSDTVSEVGGWTDGELELDAGGRAGDGWAVPGVCVWVVDRGLTLRGLRGVQAMNSNKQTCGVYASGWYMVTFREAVNMMGQYHKLYLDRWYLVWDVLELRYVVRAG